MDGAGGGRWLDQVERLSRQRLPASVFRYVAEGARDEITLREATAAWEAVRVVPRVLRDVREVDVATDLLGTTYRLPVGVAPMSLQRAADPDGEVAMARAAAGSGVPLVVSSNAGRTFADIGGTGVSWWLQLYMSVDRDQTRALLERAVEAGASAVVLTLDTPVVATRYRDPGQDVWEDADPDWLGANLGDGPGSVAVAPASRPRAMDLGAEDLGWLARETGLPVVAKGVLHPDDAVSCVEAGVAAVWVSNHGGRQLDQTLSTARCLPAVRAAVGEGPRILVDGGVRSGLHLMVAGALGADAVLVGRPLFHALAAGGESGVSRAVGELGEELVEALRIVGCPRYADAGAIAWTTTTRDLSSGVHQRERAL